MDTGAALIELVRVVQEELTEEVVEKDMLIHALYITMVQLVGLELFALSGLVTPVNSHQLA